MFQWFRQWRAKRRRSIFRFFDGHRFREADPVLIAYRFDDDPEYRGDVHPEFLNPLPEDREPSEEETALRKNATDIIVRATRRAFGLDDWNEETGGLPTLDVIELFSAYWEYAGLVKKNTKPSPTCAPSTAATSGESSAQTTNATTPSTCSADEGSCDLPTPSSKEA